MARHGPWRTLVACDAVWVVTTAAIPLLELLGVLSFPLLVALAFLSGVPWAASMGSQSAMVSGLLGDDVRRVAGVNALLQTLTRLTYFARAGDRRRGARRLRRSGRAVARRSLVPRLPADRRLRRPARRARRERARRRPPARRVAVRARRPLDAPRHRRPGAQPGSLRRDDGGDPRARLLRPRSRRRAGGDAARPVGRRRDARQPARDPSGADGEPAPARRARVGGAGAAAVGDRREPLSARRRPSRSARPASPTASVSRRSARSRCSACRRASARRR